MKEGWEYKKIEDCCDILDSYRKPITKSKRVKGVIPYYGATGLLDYVKDYIFDESLVLLGEDGAKWGAGEASAYEISGKTWVNNHAHVLRPHKDKIVNTWLIYYLNYENLSPYIKGITVPKLNQRSMCSIVIPVPPLSEQQRIVSYLDAAFAKIDAVAKNAEEALNEAKALFQSALTKMMGPKEGWEEKTLLEIGKTQTGTTPSKSNSAFYGDYMPFIRPSEINYDGLGNLNYNSEIKLSKEGSESGRVFKTGSILMVCIGATISKVGYNEQDVSCNQQINVITPYDGFNYKFIYYAMTAPKFKAKVINEGTSSQATLPIINKRKWEQLSLAFPPIDEQINIVDKLEIMHQKICNMSSNLTRTLTECSALKQAILRQTFE